MNRPLLSIRDLNVSYEPRSRWRRPGNRRLPSAVRDVSLDVIEGQTVAVVGESGSGKTTLARAVAGLLPPASGEISFRGQDIGASVERRSPDVRRSIQYVFQNPDASLNPRRRVRGLIGRPLQHFFGTRGEEARRQVDKLLETVHLDPVLADRYPSQLSGGERQRVAIAQALAADPDLLLCDEICSALDVSVQAEILDLLRELQVVSGLSYLFISHDLAVVRHLADSVVVLYAGEIMQSGTSSEVFAEPYHPYTRLLLESIPQLGTMTPSPLSGARTEAGSVGPELESVGCPFTARCRDRIPDLCASVSPHAVRLSASALMRCHFVEASILGSSSPKPPAPQVMGTPFPYNRRDA